MSDEIPQTDPPPYGPHSFPPPPPPLPASPPFEQSAPSGTPYTTRNTGSPLPGGPVFGSGKLSESDDKTYCVLSHILCIFVGFLAPLLFLLLKKDESPAVEAHAKESLNFQITLIIASLACGILTLISCGFLFFLLFIPPIYGVVMCIIASVSASEGKLYQYPMTIRLIK